MEGIKARWGFGKGQILHPLLGKSQSSQFESNALITVLLACRE